MKFKAICTDIDGTLLDHRRELSEVTIKTFQKLNGAVSVILASSRMPSAMRHLQKQLGILNEPLICYNGGYIIHERAGTSPEVLHSVYIPTDVCAGIIKLSESTEIHVSLYFEDEWYAPQWDYWAEREARITKVEPRVMPLGDVLQDWEMRSIGAHKVMCMGPEEQITKLEQDLLSQYSYDIHVYRSRPTYLELAPKIISKGSGLKLLLEKKFSFSLEEVMAFGDNYNDIELLQFAGKGIAVSNAREEVRAVADEITSDSKADGVAIFLQRHFNL